MKTYSDKQLKELVKQAVELNIPLYRETTIEDIEVLIKHELLKTYGHQISNN